MQVLPLGVYSPLLGAPSNRAMDALIQNNACLLDEQNPRCLEDWENLDFQDLVVDGECFQVEVHCCGGEVAAESLILSPPIGFPFDLLLLLYSTIMANIPPPDHAMDLPVDDPIHPDPALVIILDHAPVQLEGHANENIEEEDPKEGPKENKLVPESNNMNGFVLHMISQPEGNMNGWLVEDDEDEEKEEEEDEEMNEGGEENNDDDDAEIINPYEETDPLNKPPPTSDDESEFAPSVVHVANDNGMPVPPVIYWVYAPGPICCTLKSLHRVAKRLDKQMYEGHKTEGRMAKKFKENDTQMNRHEFDITVLDAEVRRNSVDYAKMKELIEGMSDRFNKLELQCHRAERLSRWEA
ncbi:hypothetical protein Tco_1211617 [Tanacetum coccineum]